MRAALAAAMIVAVLPAATQAADYAGGTAPETKGKSERQLTLIGIRTADDGTARVSVKVATCIVAKTTGRPQIAPDGTFSLDQIVGGRVREDSRLRQVTRIRMSGQVGGGAASGTVRADVRLTRRGRTIDRCTSGTRTWQARAAVAEPAAGAPQPNGAYHGLTSQAQGRPLAFVLRVDPRAQRIRTAAFEYRQRCRRGGFSWENITPGGPIAADGSFRLRERFSFRWAEGLERFRVKVDGHFTPSGVSGTLSVSSVLRSPGGRVIDRCATGRLGFAALL